MYDSLMHIAPYLLLLIFAWVLPTGRSREKKLAMIFGAANVIGSLPWVCAEMAQSRAGWPRMVSYIIVLLTVLVCVAVLLYKRRSENGEKNAEEKANP